MRADDEEVLELAVEVTALRLRRATGHGRHCVECFIGESGPPVVPLDKHSTICAFALEQKRFGRRELEADSGELLRCPRGNDPSTVGGFDQRSKFSVNSGHDRPGRRHIVEDLVLEDCPEERVRPCAQHAHMRSGQVSQNLILRNRPVEHDICDPQCLCVLSQRVTVITVPDDQEPDTAAPQDLCTLQQRLEAVPASKGTHIRANEMVARVQRKVRNRTNR